MKTLSPMGVLHSLWRHKNKNIYCSFNSAFINIKIQKELLWTLLKYCLVERKNIYDLKSYRQLDKGKGYLSLTLNLVPLVVLSIWIQQVEKKRRTQATANVLLIFWGKTTWRSSLGESTSSYYDKYYDYFYLLLLVRFS